MSGFLHALFLTVALAAGGATAQGAAAAPAADPFVDPSIDPFPAAPSDSAAAEPDGGEPEKAPASEGEEGSDAGWVDASHARVQRGINSLVLRLDRFFGQPAHDPDEPPTSHIRLRNEVRTSEEEALGGRTSIAASLRLPTAESLLSRFSLLVVGETDPEPANDTEVDRVPPRFDARVEAAGGALELRYDLFRARHTLVDAGAGVRFGFPPPPYTRVRLAQGFPLGASVVGHLGQSLFWARMQGFGETTRLDIHRAFGTRTLARWWSIGTIDEVSRGYEWSSELGLHRTLGARTGLYTAASIAGATRAVADVDRYRVYTRLRRDVHRGWAFLEVEPEVAWPADEDTGRRSRSFGVILRLEVQFRSDGSTGTPLASDPPLPAKVRPVDSGMS